jgi:cell division protease FtsH
LGSEEKKHSADQKNGAGAPKRPTESDGGKKTPRGRGSKPVLIWLLIIAAVFMGLRSIESYSGQRETRITYSQFKELLNNPELSISEASVTQKGDGRAVLRGQVSDPAELAEVSGAKGNAAANKFFVVNLPFLDSQMLGVWDEAGFKYTFEQERMWGSVIFQIGIIVMISVVFYMLFIRNMQSAQKGMFSFGKSRAKLHNIDRPQVTFADAAGVEEAKAELAEIIDFLKDPKKFKKLGGKIPKGVLLLGPPGTGKTLLARCVAGEAGVPFLSMSGSDFVEMFVGVGASRVRDLFETAKKNSPCIVFIDEIDAVGRQRGAGLGGGHDEREQTLNQMLVEMDGFEPNSGVILIAATNRADVLDPALLRPGRFDRQVVVDAPDVKGREGILKVHTKETPLAEDVDLYTIARGTPGFVGADLANLVNEAALMAARFNQDIVTMLDFEEAKDKVLMGTERKSMVLSEKQKQITAYHEAGHAVCNLHCEEADSLHKVTIIPRGRALGVTFSLPGEDRHMHTKQFILDQVCIFLGGRIAEEIIFGNQTTGASNDIKRATGLVRKMVCDFGMTDELGPVSYGDKDDSIFIGREMNRHRDYSESTAEAIDRLVRSIIEEQAVRAKKILTDHREQLERLAKALLEHELLDREEIMKVISGATLAAAKKTRSFLPRKPAAASGEINVTIPSEVPVPVTEENAASGSPLS